MGDDFAKAMKIDGNLALMRRVMNVNAKAWEGDMSDAEHLQARFQTVAEKWRKAAGEFPEHADDIRLFADFAEAMAKKMERWK